MFILRFLLGLIFLAALALYLLCTGLVAEMVRAYIPIDLKGMEFFALPLLLLFIYGVGYIIDKVYIKLDKEDK